MDYDNPQFIAAVKKVLGSLPDETQEKAEASEPTTTPDVKEEFTSPTLHTFQVSDALRDRVKRQSAQEEKGHALWKDRIETLAIGIALLYTIFAGYSWWELNTQNINQSAANLNATSMAAETLRQGRVALAETTKNFRIDERGWVKLSPPQISKLDQRVLETTFTATNTGKTPARNITVRYKFRLVEHAILSGPPDSWKEDGTIQWATLAPTGGSSDYTTHGDKGRDLGQINFWRIRDGFLVVHEFVELGYDDAFGEHHTTSACVYRKELFNPPAANVGVGTRQFVMAYCKKGNDMN